MRRERNRQASLVLVSVGALLVGAMAVSSVPKLPDLLGWNGEHAQGDVLLWVLLAAIPVSAGGVVAWIAAWRLWHERRAARSWAALLSVLALAGALAVAGTSSGLWGPWVAIVPGVALGSTLTLALLFEPRRRSRDPRHAAGTGGA